MLLRLEDLCISHPESRHAPVTKKRPRSLSKTEPSRSATLIDSESVPLSPSASSDAGQATNLADDFGDSEHREKYGCANLLDADTQMLEAAAKLDTIMSMRADPTVAVELLLFPPPPATSGNHTGVWAEAAERAERWLCSRDWTKSGLIRVTPSSVLLASLQGNFTDSMWYNRRMDRLAHAPITATMLQVSSPHSHAAWREGGSLVGMYKKFLHVHHHH